MPFTYGFIKLGIKPNTITLLSLASFLIGGSYFIQESYLVSGLFWVLSYVLDCTDGAVARATSGQSKFGAYLDVIIDRFISLLFLCLLVNQATRLFENDTFTQAVIITGSFGIAANAIISNLRVLYFPELKGIASRKGTLFSKPIFRWPYELMDTGNVFLLVSLAFYFHLEKEVLLIYTLISTPLLILNFILAKKNSD